MSGKEITKRIVDVFVSATFLIIMGLPMVLISILIKVSSRGPIIYRQERVGKDGKSFILYKFRSMKCENGNVTYVTDDERTTYIGKHLRRWRLDEIPQALNVLFGDMSLVGPRPTLPYQVERYNKEQKRRLSVKPGMTGWAQINGNRAITWAQRIELDLWYVDNWSILLDVLIVLRTPLALFKMSRLNAEIGRAKDEISDI